jgi:hypothetical protein
MRKLWLGTVAALIASPLLALPAAAAPCVTASVATYEAAGFSCSVDGVTFSNIVVSSIGNVTLGNFTPFVQGNEFGLSLNYLAVAGSTGADVAWSYNVAGNLLEDVYMAFTGTTTGTGTSSLSETLSNGTVLSLSSPGATSTTFPPTASLGVIKDQSDLTGTDGTSNSSLLTNAFSLTTPIPGALPLFATGLVGLWGVRKRRRNNKGSAVAA